LAFAVGWGRGIKKVFFKNKGRKQKLRGREMTGESSW